MIYQRGNHVFGFFKRVVLRLPRFDGILGHRDIVPRVHLDSFLNDPTAEDRPAERSDMLQGISALSAGQKSCSILVI
jgi:hypothetical protein